MSPDRPNVHEPVMIEESIQALAVEPGGRYIDCTVDGGGHAEAIMEHAAPGGQLLGLDADPTMISRARDRLKRFGAAALIVNNNFAALQAVCLQFDFFPVHGVLFDLGLSSIQLAESERGFSFQYDAPLDMRFSPQQEITAGDVVNRSSESELAHIIRTYGEEGYARQIAHRIVTDRPIHTTQELARTIESAVGGRHGKIHPATKTFQALRIVVNEELKNLESALGQAVDVLGPTGRLVVVSYHSLEDRIVKRFMLREARGCVCPPEIPACVCGRKPRLRLLNRRVIIPSPEEIRSNPRSRSAKLRAAEKLLTADSLAESQEPSFFAPEGRGWRRPSILKRIRSVYSLT